MKKRLLIFLPLVILITLLFLIYAAEPSVLSAQDSRRSIFGELLSKIHDTKQNLSFRSVERKIESSLGTYGVYVYDLSTGKKFEYNESVEFYGASLFKLPIAVALMKQVEQNAKSLDSEIMYTSQDYTTGTGTISSSVQGTKFTYDDVLNKLLKESDNSAQLMLQRSLGWNNINPAFNIANNQINFTQNNVVTAELYAQWLIAFLDTDYISSESKSYIKEISASTSFDNRINSGLSESVNFSHKIGSWPDEASWHDCGIAYDYNSTLVVCLLSKNTTYTDFIAVSKELGKFVSSLVE